jgi:solute carrier family 13 (sodium-dependent dicarboxylate transporter), member 2/3/5
MNTENSTVGLDAPARDNPAIHLGMDRKQKSVARELLAAFITIFVPAAVWFAPLNMNVTARHAFAIGLFMVIGWMTEVMPHAVTGLVGCYLFWILGVVNFDAAFGGFSDETTWFYVGILLFGMMASETGLSRRLAVQLLKRFGDSYSNILLGLILFSFLLTFIVPSGVACVVIEASIAIGLLQAYGYAAGSNVARAIFITLTYTAGLFDKMLMAGAASILGRGLIVKYTGVQIYWSQWFLAFLPLSIVTIIVMWRYVLWLYPPEKTQMTGGTEFFARELERLGPWKAVEKRAMLYMFVALALWMTDFYHHISPSKIGIGIGLLAMLPRVGILQFDVVKAKLNFMSVFFVASAISLGRVLIQTKALAVLTGAMFGWMAPLITNKFTAVIVPYWTALGYHLLLGNELSMLSTSILPLVQFAQLHHFDPVALGMLWTFASGGKIFVYQSAVMIVGYSYGYFDARDMLRVGGFLCLVEAVLLLIVVPFYWPLLGL